MEYQELYKMIPYVVTLLVLVITSMRSKRENQPPASLGLAYFLSLIHICRIQTSKSKQLVWIGETVNITYFTKNHSTIDITDTRNGQDVYKRQVPEDAKSGDTIHIIMEGVDGGGTNPVAYQRVIVTVK